jgi:hypothetical protein
VADIRWSVQCENQTRSQSLFFMSESRVCVQYIIDSHLHSITHATGIKDTHSGKVNQFEKNRRDNLHKSLYYSEFTLNRKYKQSPS